MQLRKIIAAWGILALVIVQMAMAQHNATHPEHGLSSASAQHETLDHNDHEQAPLDDRECPECLLIKSLQTAFYADSTVNIGITLHTQAPPLAATGYISHYAASAYNPRAPPVFLI